jgi:hypothetical protein
VALQGSVSWSSNPAPVIHWQLYSGPAPVSFANTNLTNTTVVFSAPGTYTLLLGAADGVHAVAYDAVVLTATQSLILGISRTGPNVILNWTGASAPYVIEHADALPATQWSSVLTTNGLSAAIPAAATAGFFRVRGQ